MTGQSWQPKDEQQLQNLCEFIRQGWLAGKYPVFTVETETRTVKQNKSLHKYLANLANDLNGAGLDMRKVLKPEIDIPWTKESAKEHLWRPIQKAMFQELSTKDLDTKQVGEVYNVLSRHLSQKFGITVDWPSLR